MPITTYPAAYQPIDERVVLEYTPITSYRNYVTVDLYQGNDYSNLIFSGVYYKFDKAIYSIDITSILENKLSYSEDFSSSTLVKNAYQYKIAISEETSHGNIQGVSFTGYIIYEYKNKLSIVNKNIANKYKEVNNIYFGTTALSNSYSDSFNNVGDYENIYINTFVSGATNIVCSFFSSNFTRLATVTATTYSFNSIYTMVNYNLVDLRVSNQANYDACKYITVYFAFNNTSIIFSMHNCDILKYNNYNPIILYYVNRLGGIDYQLFKMKYNKSIDSVIKTYNTNFNNVNTKKIISNEITDKYTLNTDYLNEYDYNCLEELITSPCIYMQNTSSLNETNFIRTVILDNNFTYKEMIKDKLFNLTVNIEYAIKNYRR